MDGKPTTIDTRLIHAGEPKPRIDGAVVMPIFQSSTYEYTGITEGLIRLSVGLESTDDIIADFEQALGR